MTMQPANVPDCNSLTDNAKDSYDMVQLHGSRALGEPCYSPSWQARSALGKL